MNIESIRACEQCLSYEVCQFKPVERPHECIYWKDKTEFVSNKNIFHNLCAYMHEYFVRTPDGKIVSFNEHTHCPTVVYSNDKDFVESWELRGKGFGLHILHHDLRPFENIIKDFKPFQMTQHSFQNYLRKVGYIDARQSK